MYLSFLIDGNLMPPVLFVIDALRMIFLPGQDGKEGSVFTIGLLLLLTVSFTGIAIGATLTTKTKFKTVQEPY